MTLIPRLIQPAVENALFRHKMIVLYGARGVGKTTLLRAVIEPHQADTLYLDCDDPAARDALSRRRKSDLRALLGGRSLLVIDEAQRAPGIAATLKALGEHFPETQVIAAGSSLLFDISRNVNEPLTAGKLRFYLYPLSLQELLSHYSADEMKAQLGQRLVFGMYPAVIEHPDPAAVLQKILQENPYRDVIERLLVKNPDHLWRLLQVLALRVGGEVSYNELGDELGVDKSTAARYVSLLEQAHLVFQISPFNRKLGKELGKLRKIYFYDVGLRNAVIRSFNPVELRPDVEALWENYFISERFKFNRNRRRYDSSYFWRTYDGACLDYLEESEGMLQVFACRWNPGKWRAPSSFVSAYPNSRFRMVNRENFLEFLAG